MGKTRKKKGTRKAGGAALPSFLPFYFLVFAISIERTRLSRSLEQASSCLQCLSLLYVTTSLKKLKTKRGSDSLHIPFTTILYSFALFKICGIPKMEYCEIRSQVYISQFLNVCLFNAMCIRPDSNVAFHISEITESNANEGEQ